jgi:hypothetical protein
MDRILLRVESKDQRALAVGFDFESGKKGIAGIPARWNLQICHLWRKPVADRYPESTRGEDFDEPGFGFSLRLATAIGKGTSRINSDFEHARLFVR